MSDPKVTIRKRVWIEANTAPQRRCYDGVHAKSELRWSGWGAIEHGVDARLAPARLVFWRHLNDYAVSQRGEVGTRAEFDSVPERSEEEAQ